VNKLLIVESPAKAKTIQKYLGKDFEVLASMGHVRDLPKSRMGVDIENNFEPEYINMRDKSKLIKALKTAAKKSDKVYLATDPDREGEAISWHLAHLLDLDLNEANRVEFTEITKSGVRNGMAHPHKINMSLVNAQQARRVLDRVVGYKLSPFLWKKIRSGLSAGRVQSVALRLVVERDRAIKEFVPTEYWSINAKMSAPGSKKIFNSHLHTIKGKKAAIDNEEQANKILSDLNGEEYIVKSVKKKTTQKAPAPPFTTSTLQQEAARKLNFQARRTMSIAQNLYEGIDVAGIGAVGLITYMRTDSLRISEEAKKTAGNFIEQTYGKNYLPPSPRFYKSKNNSQDAHEAIRPSMPELTPDRVKSSLSTEQYKLYKLIWDRFIASQMANQVLDTVSVDINAGDYGFRASGYSVKFDGFTVLYTEGKDVKDEEENNKMLPEINEKDNIKLKEIKGEQHFTQPPAHFTEATLIKTLEENGIGRPSTYAPTISTITARFYVEREGKILKSTVLGEVVSDLVSEYFKNIVDEKFTAGFESELDTIEQGEKQWQKLISDFYAGFDSELKKAELALDGEKIRVPSEETDEVCTLCGKPMAIKFGRFGKFLACTGYPDCKNTKKIVKPTEGNCPVCGKEIVVKKSKKGRTFYGCSSYPACEFMTWSIPTAEKCPKCSCSLFKKAGRSPKLICLKDECGYERDV
jgi:DNA topoisomerase-1